MSPLVVECIVSPPLDTNVYVVADPDTGETIVLDPSFSGKRAIQLCEQRQWSIRHIVLTHGHVDHSHDVAMLARASGAPVLTHPESAVLLNDPMLSGASFLSVHFDPWGLTEPVLDGDTISVGNGSFQVLHTPGHTPGCVCLLGEGICFTGDVLFRDSVGRQDLPGGDPDIFLQSIRRLARVMSPETILYPGHGAQTTLKRELDQNYYLRQYLTE